MIERTEYPRPDLVRDSYQSLNGTWDFDFDDEDLGISEKWYKSHDYKKTITVPFAYQAPASGIGDTSVHDILWYRKEVSLEQDPAGKDVLLHFGAVDYICDVYINGEFVGHHQGGDSPFTIQVNKFCQDKNWDLCLRVFDPCEDETIPRGKQFWEKTPRSIWYTPTSGIWQSVWIEQVCPKRIEKLRMTTRFEEGTEEIRLFFNGNVAGCNLKTKVCLENDLVWESQTRCIGQQLSVLADIVQNHIFRSNFHDSGYTWTPESPRLFDVELILEDESGNTLDQVKTYFGFRKVHAEQGMIYLNNKPYYQRLVLDQGYWREGLLTAPTDEDYKKDIEASKAMGFNGCRKHQKAEDPRFLYWADKLGYLVWGECASVPTFGINQMNREMELWKEIVERDYNHPSIICWVPLNESWGVPNIHADRQQQEYSKALYHYLHAADPTRLVISNDGWEQTDTDVCAIHNYEHGDPGTLRAEIFEKMFSSRKELVGHPCGVWDVYAKGTKDQGAPIVLSEFGGIGYTPNQNKGEDWGYTRVNSEQAYVEEYKRILDVVLDSPVLAGFCYTQLTDVEQEVNGLLTYDRQWKCKPEAIKEINERYRRLRVNEED
ncbi:MAG: glycoside hydrolase family 2 [Pseudobutyrivibrio sp.]|nr:glycoside hydrolase family 2 [Pseudobutyrivibrio sp.]